MPVQLRAIVIAVCGCPGAGKTTVASAAADHLGLPLVTRDQIKVGLGWSSASRVVADAAAIEQRLQRRLADGGPVAQQLASQHRSGQMDPAIFEPPGTVDVVTRIDTSDGPAPDVGPIELAATDLITSATAGGTPSGGGDVSSAPAVRGTNHVTIATGDVERSVAFYSDVLGIAAVRDLG